MTTETVGVTTVERPWPYCSGHETFAVHCEYCLEACVDRYLDVHEFCPKESAKECQHELDLTERSWPEPRDGTTWLHCKACQKHVWTVPSRLLA